jgi:hypothetical protein
MVKMEESWEKIAVCAFAADREEDASDTEASRAFVPLTSIATRQHLRCSPFSREA